jgi:hypothetical protein
MSEKELLDNLTQIDGLLAKCINPALNRADHDGIRQTMSLVFQRVKLSYTLEDEKRAMQDAKKMPEQVVEFVKNGD